MPFFTGPRMNSLSSLEKPVLSQMFGKADGMIGCRHPPQIYSNISVFSPFINKLYEQIQGKVAILDEPEPPMPVQNINAETKTQYEQEAPQEHRPLQLSRWAMLTFKGIHCTC